MDCEMVKAQPIMNGEYYGTPEVGVGVFHGKGKLYEHGQCTEGKWEAGRLTKSISASVFEEGQCHKMWLSNPDSLNLESTGKDC